MIRAERDDWLTKQDSATSQELCRSARTTKHSSGRSGGLYGVAASKVDELAERVLAVAGKPFSTLKEQLLRSLAGRSTTPSAKGMVQFVQGGLERLNSYRHEVAHQATESGDSATAKLREVFADGQEKTERMLRACLSS